MPNEFDLLEGAVTAVLLALLAPLDDSAVGRVLGHASQWHEDRMDDRVVARDAARRAAA